MTSSSSSSSSYYVFDKNLAKRTLERVSQKFVVDEEIAKGLLEMEPYVVDKNENLLDRVLKHLDNLKRLVIERGEFSDPPTAEDILFFEYVYKILEFMKQLDQTFVYGPPLTQDSAALRSQAPSVVTIEDPAVSSQGPLVVTTEDPPAILEDLA